MEKEEKVSNKKQKKGMKIMKRLKKAASILLAGILVMAMGITASAKTITINNATTGHEYKIYQIFEEYTQ